MTTERKGRRLRLTRTRAVLVGLLGLAACGEGGDPVDLSPPDMNPLSCDLESRFLVTGAVIDGIPSIDEPNWVAAAERVPAYLDADTRIIGLQVDETAYAIPHNVLWFHEIVNLDTAGEHLAVTYCPLTGSSLVFDRAPVGDATFGVSGLLYKNNLILYDRNDLTSRWPQMVGEARCGPRANTPLPQWPVTETTWGAWLALHPRTLVLSEDQGHSLDYRASNYPYGFYEDYRVTSFFIRRAMPDLDHRRPTKERVLGVPPERGSTSGGEKGEGEPGIAFPFDALMDLPGVVQVVDFEWAGGPAVVLWDDLAKGGMGYRPRTSAGVNVSLTAEASGIVDLETGSLWSIDGRAVSGPLEGSRLVPLERTHVAFWGAWAAFYPQTVLWEG